MSYLTINDRNLSMIQEISYALAKHALEKRKSKTMEKMIGNMNFHNNIEIKRLKEVPALAKNVRNTFKGKKSSTASKIDNTAKLVGAFTQNFALPQNTMNNEIEADKKGIGLRHVGKEAKKAFRLHRAIERKEKRMPGWKESTKDTPLNHKKQEMKIEDIDPKRKVPTLDETKKQNEIKRQNEEKRINGISRSKTNQKLSIDDEERRARTSKLNPPTPEMIEAKRKFKEERRKKDQKEMNGINNPNYNKYILLRFGSEARKHPTNSIPGLDKTKD